MRSIRPVLTVSLVLVLGGAAMVRSAGAADPLDKAKSAKVKALAKGKILGLHVAEVNVGDDGALRVRAGLDTECGTVAGIKKVQGKCIAALPFGELRFVQLSGWVTIGQVGVSVTMAGTIQTGGWISFKATRLSGLVALAAIDARTTGGLTLLLVPKKNTWFTNDMTLDALPDPYWYDPSPARNQLAPYYPPATGDDDCPDCGGDYGDGGCEDCEDQGTSASDDSVISVEFPLSWFAYSGKQMRKGQEQALVGEYGRLATTRGALYWSTATSEIVTLQQLPDGRGAAAALAALMKKLPANLEARLAAVKDRPAALDRTAAIYEDTQLLFRYLGAAAQTAARPPEENEYGGGAYGGGEYGGTGSRDNADAGDVHAALRKALEGVSALGELVSADVAAFAAAPKLPTGEALLKWTKAHQALLRDPRFPEVFAAWAAALVAAKQPGLAIASGAFDPVVTAAMSGTLAGTLTAIARADLDASFGKEFTFPYGSGAAAETFANVAWFLGLSWTTLVQSKDGLALIERFAEYLVENPGFAPELPERFLAAHAKFFQDTDAGQKIALKIVPKIDARKRADKHDRIKELVASHKKVAAACKKASKAGTALAATWKKKYAKMKAPEREKLQTQGRSLAYEVQGYQSQLKYIIEQLNALEAWDEAGKAYTDLSACKF